MIKMDTSTSKINNSVITGSNLHLIFYDLAEKDYISKTNYEKFVKAIRENNVTDFLLIGEIIVRGVLIKLNTKLDKNFYKHAGWNTILKTSWENKIITNSTIYSYLWVFAKATHEIKNDIADITKHEAMVHYTVFFSFLIEIHNYIMNLSEPEKKNRFLHKFLG